MNVVRVIGYATVCTNVYVFSRWHFHPKVDRDPNDKSGVPPPVDPVKRAKQEQFMYENWTCSLTNLKEGRWWTLVTPAFSHASGFHFGMSMFGLVQAYRILRFIGVSAPRVVGLGLGSAVAANVAFLLDQATRPQQLRESAGFGASGMIYGLFTGAMLAVPKIPMGIPLVPVTFSLRSMVLTATAMDAVLWIWERVQNSRRPHPLFGSKNSIAYSAHLGGAAFGAVFYALALRRYRGFLVPHRR